MNNLEAMQALIEGNKIKKNSWMCFEYIYLSKDYCLLDEDGAFVESNFLFPLGEDSWELWGDPKVTNESEERLDDVIRLLVANIGMEYNVRTNLPPICDWFYNKYKDKL